MKKYQLTTILLLSIFVFSCKEKTQLPQQVEYLDPQINFAELELDFKKWWTYHSNNIALSSNFTGLNEKSDTITKKQFLEKLITSEYIPVRLKSDEGFETYKLFKLDPTANKGIGSTIKNESWTSLKYYNMEGSPFPEFDFTDLDGNLYTNENTKGKTVILKTWFINCGACIAEFPELNELVEKYKQRNDVIFMSLAWDSKSELESFLQKKKFEYKIFPDQRDFIENHLSLQIYPTHMIVDRNGIILKVVNKASEMISFFENNKLAEKEFISTNTRKLYTASDTRSD